MSILNATRGSLKRSRKPSRAGLPIFAICKGLQVFNVALGGTLKLDIQGHNLPEQKDHDIQPLRNDRAAAHRFEMVNSSHHQAIDRLADGCEVESWCATDDIIEQMRLRDHPFALAVQYHPERGKIYDALFEDFFSHVGRTPVGRFYRTAPRAIEVNRPYPARHLHLQFRLARLKMVVRQRL